VTTYQIVFGDVAQAEADDAYLYLSQRASLPVATRWYSGLLAQIREKLSFMPARFASAPDTAAFPGLIVRQMLYGSGRSTYRVLFHIVEPADEEDEQAGAVIVLRVRHSAMRLLTDLEPTEQGDN
jgi:plasmid stabilization system protein ParE